MRLLAERLESLGLCALRFDYDGIGDSAGDSNDSDRVSAWLASTARAVALVRSTGVNQVTVVGMRLGALLGAQAAAEGGGVDQLVLWDPCVSGRSFLTEQRAIAAISFGTTGSSDGSVQGPGFLYGSETVRELSELAFSRFQVPLARRALVLIRPDRPAGKRLGASFASSIEWDKAVGQADLFEVEAPHQALPYTTIERIATWVSDGAQTCSVALKLPPVAGVATVDFDTVGQAVTERPIWMGPAGLFGVLTEVAGTEVASMERKCGPVVVFLNVANEHHVGPARLWVELARRWALAGITSVRVDLSGLGDSPRRYPDQLEFFARLPEAFQDLDDITSAVSPDEPKNVVIVGFSSGGYQAIDSALELLPKGIVAVNPSLSFVPPECRAGLPIDPRRKVALPQSAVVPRFRGSNLHSELLLRFPRLRWRLRTLPTRHARIHRLRLVVCNLGWRIRMLSAPSCRSGAWLSKLVDAGVDVLLVCGEHEARPIRAGASRRKLSNLVRSGRLRFECVPELEHGLLIDAQYRTVADLTTEHVVSRFAPRRNSTASSVTAESA
jgi:alpha-beta hydrolase superfamily lysophospholipase